MPALQNLLAVYGALDQAATGRGVGGPSSSMTFGTGVLDPNLLGLANGLDVAIARTAEDSGGLGEPSEPGRSDLVATLNAIQADDAAGRTLTTPQKLRLFTALLDIARLAGTRSVDQTLPNFADPLADPLLVDTLVNLGPGAVPPEQRRARVLAAAPDLFAAARTVTSPEGIEALVHTSVSTGVLSPDVLYVGTCQTRVVTVDGHDCVVLDTECHAPDVSLANLKAIVNPFNWATNYPSFFESMNPAGPPGADGWPKVLETVSLLGGGLVPVHTQLRYYPSVDGPGETIARVDYDLGLPQPGLGDGQVKVDRGFINMWADNATNDPAKPGVRARTRKVVHIDQVSPYYQQWVKVLGYGDASAEFLLGPAKNPPADAYAFDYQGGNPAAQTSKGTTTAGPAPTRGTAPHFAPIAVGIWTDVMKTLTSDYTDLAGKWMSGTLTIDEAAHYATKTTDAVVRAPFEFLQALTAPRTPPRKQASDESKRGDRP